MIEALRTTSVASLQTFLTEFKFIKNDQTESEFKFAQKFCEFKFEFINLYRVYAESK